MRVHNSRLNRYTVKSRLGTTSRQHFTALDTLTFYLVEHYSVAPAGDLVAFSGFTRTFH